MSSSVSRYSRAMQATAWILDPRHRTLRLTCDMPARTSAFAAIRDLAQRDFGIALGLPIGARALDSAPELLFVAPAWAGRKDIISLSELASTDERGFALYIDAMLGGWCPPTRDLDVFSFGDTPELA